MTDSWDIPEYDEKEGGPPSDRHGKLDEDAREVENRGRRFGRRITRHKFTSLKLHKRKPVTPEGLASGEAEQQLRRQLEPRPVMAAVMPGRPQRFFDVAAYVYSRGWARTLSEARRLVRRGEVSVNGATYSEPHFPIKDLTYDDYGRPRVMVEGRPDPRRVT